MLTGAAFFVDRDDGHIWCDSCVPAEVVQMAAPPKGRKQHNRRYTIVETGELLVSHILPRAAKPQRVRARCHSCGAVQPGPAA